MEREPEDMRDIGDPGVAESEHGRSKITHNARENIGALGQGFKQLFHHPRRRSSISPHDISSTLSATPMGSPAPEPQEAGPEAGDAPSPPDADPPPAALSRVLQQVMKRGASLQSRRQLTSDPPRAGPQSRPRSASTTDTLCSPALLETQLPSAYPSTQDPDRLEVCGLASLVPVVGVCPVEGGDSPSDLLHSRQVVAQLQQKILRLTEQIRVEQAARNVNVAEYLKLANNADRQQSARIKQVFEKKNQKSAQTVLQLQKKLDLCQCKLREAEQSGPARQHKDVQQGQRDVGARVVTKPREGTSLVRSKFGSAENMWVASRERQEDLIGEEMQSSPRYGSEDEASSTTSGSGGAHSASGVPGATHSSRAALRNLKSLGLDVLFHQLQDIGQGQARLEDALDKLKGHYEKDYQRLMQDLHEQRFRCEHLEEQLNDLMELHQNEMLTLKQELASVEEKIADQSFEGGKDMQEALEACQTRICKMELQQQQQGGQMEGPDGRPRDPLLGKLITVLLALMSVLLVCVSTAASCTVPLLKTRSRTLGSLLLLLLLALLWRYWDTLVPCLDQLLEVYT